MKIVGIGYKKGRGKDTLANFMLNYLQIHCGCSVKKIGFADKLKDICYQLYGWGGLQRGVYYESHYEAKETKLPKLNQTPREMWIGLGNAVRAYRASTWRDAVTQNDHKCDILLVKDLGFWNEAVDIAKGGGILIRIDRQGEMATDGRETELDNWTDWNAVVDNNGCLQDLHRRARDICEGFLL